MRTNAMAGLADHVSRRLAAPLPGLAAQHRFAPQPILAGWSADLRPVTARRAAALALIYPGLEGPSIVLTERHPDLPHHPGQVSLPGGAIDPDESAVDAARREAYEEVGIDPGTIEILGALSTLWIPPSNFVLEPFVGFSDERPVFRPHTAEVAAVLEVPLAALMAADATGWGQRERRGDIIDYPYFLVEGRHVWGATAMVLNEFVCLWDPQHGPGSKR